MVTRTLSGRHGLCYRRSGTWRLGIQPTWQKLEITPCLPPDWPRAEADILYKGQRQHVTIADGKVQVQPESRSLQCHLVGDGFQSAQDRLWTRIPRTSISRFYSDRLTLSRRRNGTYESPIHDWAAQPNCERSKSLVTSARASYRHVETSNDRFKTVQFAHRDSASGRRKILIRSIRSKAKQNASESTLPWFVRVRIRPALIDAFRVIGGS